MDPRISLVIFGVILIIIGVVVTPVYYALGNACFWIGVPVTVIGILLIIFT